MQPARILVVDDDPLVRKSLSSLLDLEGHEVEMSDSVEGARALLSSSSFHLILTDIKMPDADGFALLETAQQECPQTLVVMITGYGSIEQAVRAVKMGAYDYLTKPVMDEELNSLVGRALEEHRRLEEKEAPAEQPSHDDRFGTLIGRDAKMHEVFELVRIVADSRATVLLTGQSGTGKSLVAREIHRHSPRRDGPFIEVSCGALPETLLESELFGHTRGAFTGAVFETQGKFEAAHGGTIFLDEISTAPPAMQVKLLRVLESMELQKVGGTRNIPVDVRVVLATNNDLDAQVEGGNFRKDLYYRIKVITIDLAPLCERVGDIQLLASEFLRVFNSQNDRRILGFTPSAMHALQRYSWPGNVRELENVVERAVILTRGQYITAEDLPEPVARSARRPASDDRVDLKASLAEPEREIIERALTLHAGSRKEAARYLGVSRTTLYHKMKRHGLLATPANRWSRRPQAGAASS